MVRRAAAVLLLAGGGAWCAPWIRLASPHFEIYTDTSERTARRTLERFEQAARLLSSAAQGTGTIPLKTRVLLFASERDYAVLRPSPVVRGFYQSGPDLDYIAMLNGPDIDRIILHEYTHSVLNHAAAPLPQWLEEGLAELYSTLAVNGKRTSVGAPIPLHVETLRREPWLTGSELSAVGRESSQYNEADKAGVFYAQSWALTHMLTFGENFRGKLWPFLDALSSGDAPAAAFEKAFGMNIDVAVRNLDSYVRTGFRATEIEGPGAENIPSTEPELLDPVIAQQAKAEVLLLMRREEAARRIYREIAKRNPLSPAAQTGLAVIAMRDEDRESARRFFERAIELGAKDGSTYFEYAMLLRDTGAPQGQVTEFLERAIAANPAHAEAHFLLGIRASDADRFSDAVTHLRAATGILPRQAYFWQALSFAYHKLGQTDEARTAALRALRAARTDHETEMAKGALQLIGDARPAARRSNIEVITPKSWTNPQGDRKVSGRLLQVDCENKPVQLHIRTAAETLVLDVADPNSIVVQDSAGKRTMSCGSQSAVPVTVEFVERTRSVTAIEFH